MSNNPENYTDIVREYALLQDRVAPDLARMEEIKKVLKGLDYGTHDIAGLKIGIGHNSRLDAKKAAEMYPEEQYPDLYKTSLDSAALKRVVAPAVYEAMSNEGDPRVTIK